MASNNVLQHLLAIFNETSCSDEQTRDKLIALKQRCEEMLMNTISERNTNEGNVIRVLRCEPSQLQFPHDEDLRSSNHDPVK